MNNLRAEDFIIPRDLHWGSAPLEAISRCNCLKPKKIYSAQPKCPARRRLSDWLAPIKAKDKTRRRSAMLAKHGGLKALRQRLLNVFGPYCQYCGDEVGPLPEHRPLDKKYWTIDRLDSKGDYSPYNITLACNICNNSKGTKPLVRSVRSLADMEGPQ